MIMTDLEKMLIRHEGLELKPYNDTKGILTIGVGRNLKDNGITSDEAFYLMANDIARAVKYAQETFPWFNTLSSVRQDVITDMIFNMGPARVREFVKMISAIAARDYDLAAMEMLDSAWATEVGKRAQELSAMMRTNSYQ